ncbi:MAG: hypothetical protein Q9220_006826 [cf. Caloplaca sp. 1 TL-2023]
MDPLLSTNGVSKRPWMAVGKYNGQKRNIPYKNPPLPTTAEQNTEYCEPICRDYRSWNLPVMFPFSPSKHGIVESRHQIFPDIKDFESKDGAAGEWPIKAPDHHYPGGISTTGAGAIDYWEEDDTHWR